MCPERKEPECIRWRPWPCPECSGGTTVFGHLVDGVDASGPFQSRTPDEIIEELAERERTWLLNWAKSCPHGRDEAPYMHKLDEGSEHSVYLIPGDHFVLKLTRLGGYGEYYFLNDGLTNQRRSTPGDYILRLDLIEDTFSFAAKAIGITPQGQIVSVQQFVEGDPPTQEEADEFLLASGIEPVKQKCWLWKKCVPESGIEFWIGDARADNFVKTNAGIVPIDLRMWCVVLDQPETPTVPASVE